MCFCRFQEPKELELDDRTETMLKVYEDGTTPKEKQGRYSTLHNVYT